MLPETIAWFDAPGAISIQRLMYNFLEEIGLRHTKRDAQQTEAMLGNLNLLVPKNDEYLLGKEHLLIFLNPFGVVLRVGDPLPGPEHDLILKPWKKVQMEKAVFEVLPGIECGISQQSRELSKLRQILHHEKYDFWDYDKTSNVGFLPVTASPFSGRIPVVLDRGAVRAEEGATTHPRIAKFREAGKEVWQPVEFRGAQERVFAPFREALQAAWPDSTNEINGTKMMEFWRLCRQEILQREQTGYGVLNNKWEDNNGGEEYFKTVQARNSSFQYGERYMQHALAR